MGTVRCGTLLLGLGPLHEAHPGLWTRDLHAPACSSVAAEHAHPQTVTAAPPAQGQDMHTWPGRLLTWMATRGDWEKYQSGTPNRLMSAVLVSYVSEQRVLKTLPLQQSTDATQRLILLFRKQHHSHLRGLFVMFYKFSRF